MLLVYWCLYKVLKEFSWNSFNKLEGFLLITYLKNFINIQIRLILKLFKFILYKDIDLKNISKFEKKFILHKDDFELLDVSKFFNNSSLLHNLCIQNSNTLNHLIKKNEN
jgi:hypothetical protein